MSTPAPTPDISQVLKPRGEFENIGTYAKMLKLLIEGLCGEVLPQDFQHEFLVVSISHYKNKEDARHEFLVVEVQTKGSTASDYLRFERSVEVDQMQSISSEAQTAVDKTFTDLFKLVSRRGNDNASGADIRRDARAAPMADPPVRAIYTATAHTASRGSASSLNTLSRSIMRLKDAHDSVSAEGLPTPQEADLILKIPIPPGHLSLLRFAWIAYSVNLFDPIYSVFKRQCYWFAGIIMSLVIAMVHPEGILPREIPLTDNGEEQVELDRIPLTPAASAGKYKFLRVVDLRPVVVNGAKSWADKHWKEVEEDFERIRLRREEDKKVQEAKDAQAKSDRDAAAQAIADRDAMEADKDAMEADRDAIKADRDAAARAFADRDAQWEAKVAQLEAELARRNIAAETR